MQLFVKEPSGKSITFNDSLGDLRGQIHAATGIEPEDQRLIYAGKQIDEDNRSLSLYCIDPDTTVYLLQRLGGGVGANKSSLKLKSNKTKHIKMGVAQFDRNLLAQANNVAGHVAGITEIDANTVLQDISTDNLQKLKDIMLTGKAHIAVKVDDIFKVTNSGIVMEQAKELLEESCERMSTMTAKAITARYDTVGDLVSAIDTMIGARAVPR